MDIENNIIVAKQLELLSPAGSFECAKAAVDAGADAIYMGGAKYGARAFAKSTNDDSIIDSIKFVKESGKKFYLTVNTLFKQRELKEIFLFLDPIVDVGVERDFFIFRSNSRCRSRCFYRSRLRCRYAFKK